LKERQRFSLLGLRIPHPVALFFRREVGSAVVLLRVQDFFITIA